MVFFPWSFCTVALRENKKYYSRGWFVRLITQGYSSVLKVDGFDVVAADGVLLENRCLLVVINCDKSILLWICEELGSNCSKKNSYVIFANFIFMYQSLICRKSSLRV